MKRRSFLTALGGAAAWPLIAKAQQPALPVIGFLSSGSPRAFARLTAAFREGLQTQGYVHGSNVWVEYRWAEGSYDRMAPLAGELLARHPATMVVYGPPNAVRSAIDAIPTLSP